MNDFSEQLLQAFDVVIDKKINELQFDKTIQGTIFSIVNLDIGEYKVRYKGNIFSAYSIDLKTTYKVNDQVYVTVPEGNFSNKKMIQGTVTNKSLNNSQLTTLQNSIFEISPDFNILYGNIYDNQKAYGIIAGAPPKEGEKNNCIYIYKGPEIFETDGFHGLFQQYANNYELIRIKASFLTQFYSVHSKGSYGIEIEFYAKGNNIVSYKLDLNSFNGDPYCLSVYSPQSAIIKVQKNYLLGLKSIKLFEEDFDYDNHSFIKNGQIINEQNTENPNIFVKDISIQYVEQKDLSDTNYYLMIAAPQGIAFTSNISSLDLQGRLIYMGKDIMDDKCKCQWYERDLTVMIGETNYDKEVGFGWKPLAQTTSTLSLTFDDVIYSKKYKLKVYYGEEPVILFADIEIYNHTSSYDYFIEQQTDGNDIKLQLNNRLDTGDLVGDWFLSYPDGSYNSIAEGKKQNSISISNYLKYSSIVFYCQVYNYDKDKIVGTIEHTIVNSESDEDVTITYIGEDSFRYDANGDISIEDSEKERTLQINLVWKEGFGTAYTVQWLVRDKLGKEVSIPTEKANNNGPPLSMIESFWVDSYNILHYNIRQKYKINFNNNTILIKIRTITEEVYTFEKEILFLKDGDQGTNGTTYVIAIRPYDTKTGNKLSGLQALEYDNGWKNSLPLRCYVYKDGELISKDGEINNSYNIKYKWEGINITFNEEILNTDRVTVNGVGIIDLDGPKSALEFYVKVQVDINDKMNDRKTSIYASYPIDIAVGGLDTSLVNIESIPSYIKYTASGINPQFYSNDIKYIYDEKPDNVFNSLNKSILNIETKDGLHYLKPASSFIAENVKNNNESTIGLIQCGSNRYQYLIHPIIMYLDTYGNEAINGWDGTSIKTSDSYILAPQIGAGEKDNENRFTGVVMGKDTAREKIGLYGYQKGINTFGLTQDGIAYFGSRYGGAQIVIDGTTAELYGGGQYPISSNKPEIGGECPNGMSIFLANLNPENPKTSPAIKIGAGVFNVMYDGSLTATAANITGTIYAQEGYIGCTTRFAKDGWHIDTNKISSGTGNRTVAFDSSNSDFAIWAGKNIGGTSYNQEQGKIENPAPFVVTKDGFLYAINAKIKGNVDASSGTIGGWSIERTKLQSFNGTVGMASSGSYVFWAGNSGSNDNPNMEQDAYFYVTRSGELHCKKAQINGSITANSGTIGGWKITSNRLQNEDNSVYLSASGGLKVGDGFNVTQTGYLTATGANIGGTLNVDNLNIRQGNRYANALSTNYNRNTAIKGDYIDCLGLCVGNKDRDNSYFQVDYNGNVYIGGNIKMGRGSSISWSVITDADTDNVLGQGVEANNNVKAIANGTYKNGTFINGQSIMSPKIYGGNFYTDVNTGSFSFIVRNSVQGSISYNGSGGISIGAVDSIHLISGTGSCYIGSSSNVNNIIATQGWVRDQLDSIDTTATFG